MADRKPLKLKDGQVAEFESGDQVGGVHLPDILYELNDLTDVSLASPSDKQVLTFNYSSGEWKAKAPEEVFENAALVDGSRAFTGNVTMENGLNILAGGLIIPNYSPPLGYNEPGDSYPYGLTRTSWQTSGGWPTFYGAAINLVLNGQYRFMQLIFGSNTGHLWTRTWMHASAWSATTQIA